nr:unnamed protein product [Callosobruchus chinensis]
MEMRFGRHHKPCMHGFDEFRTHRSEMTRFGNNGMMKCKKGHHQHKNKMMLKAFSRMMMGSSSESDESSNEETDRDATQDTNQVPAMGAGQKVTQAGNQEEHPTCGSSKDHCGRPMRRGRHHHGYHKDKLKMKLGKGRKDKLIWKCKKNKFQHKGGEGHKSMRAMFMDMMCSGGRREMWEGFVRMMTEQESDTGAEGQTEVVNEETNQEVAQGTGQTSSMDNNATGTEERIQKDTQSSGAKDPTV